LPKVSGPVRGNSRFAEIISGDRFDHDCRPIKAVQRTDKLLREILSVTRKDASVLRISLRYLAFEHHARELVVNAIGRHLLGMARNGAFNKTPVVVALDEAHQFLSKTVGDDVNKVQLNALG
jgi:hypothetical protein